jgi:hypothetical protein
MNDQDRSLKALLQSHKAPQLPSEFVDQALARLSAGQPQRTAPTVGALAWVAPRHKWLALASVLVLAWAAQSWLATSTDDDLMHIDTLSMSSMLVL